MIRWETIGLLVGHSGLMLGLRCDARDSRLHSEEDRVRSVASGRAILGPGEPAMHLHCPRICRWWIRRRPADEGSRGCIGDGPGRVAVG